MIWALSTCLSWRSTEAPNGGATGGGITVRANRPLTKNFSLTPSSPAKVRVGAQRSVARQVAGQERLRWPPLPGIVVAARDCTTQFSIHRTARSCQSTQRLQVL